MNSSSTFVSLVRHELKVSKQRKSKSKRAQHLSKLYIALFVVIPCILIAFFQEYIDPMYFWYILFLFPLTVIGFGHQFIHREWKDQTYSWWLTLPFSRFKLIASKFTACFIQMVGRLAEMFVIIALLGIYTTLWQGNFLQDTFHLLGWGIILYLFTLTVLPFVISFAILSQINAYSRTKNTQPWLWTLFWVVIFGAVWISGIGDGGGNLATLIAMIAGGSKAIFFPFNHLLIGAVIISWVLAYALIRYTAHLLEKQIDL